MAKKKLIKEEFKVWMFIERHAEYSDGSDTYRDLKQEDPRSLGNFTTIEKAREQVNLMADMHQFDTDDDV